MGELPSAEQIGADVEAFWRGVVDEGGEPGSGTGPREP